MLLLNAIRVLITVIGLVILDAFRAAYGLQGFPLLAMLALVMFIVFVLSDLAEEALVAYFNKDDGEKPARG